MHRMSSVKGWISGFAMLLLLLLTGNVIGQTTVAVGPTSVSGSSYFYGPVYRSSTSSTFHYNMNSYIYTAAELSAAGIVSGSFINDIRFNLNATATLSGSHTGNFQVWVQNSVASNQTTGTTWGTITSTATQVVNQTWNNSNPGAAGWKTFTFSSPYAYTGGSLIVSVRWILTPSGGSPYASGAFNWQYYSGALVPTAATIGSASGAAQSNSTALSTTSYGGNLRPLTQMSWTAGSPCSGTPAPGNTTLNSGTNPTCNNASFTLGLQNNTIGSGVTYQWQADIGGGFNNIAGATSNTYTALQSVATTYQCVVTCTNTPASTISNPYSLGLQTGVACLNYCVSSASNTADEEIFQITVNGASTPAPYANNCNVGPGPGSVASLYSNFKTLGALTTVQQGQVVAFQVRENECDGGTLYANGIAVFIDWNQDGDFADAGETAYTQGVTTAATGASPAGDKVINFNYTIPMTATVGLTGMRIVCIEGNANPPACSATPYGYGETEDWLIDISAATPCVGTPTPGNTIPSVANACPANSFLLSLQNNTLGTGVTYQWYSDNGSGYAPIAGATNPTYTATQTVATSYYCDVTCNVGGTGSSTPVSVGVNPFYNCYCTTGLGGSCAINSISSVLVTGTTLNNVTGGCTGTYNAFPQSGSTTATLITGTTYNMTIGTIAGSNTQAVIWIDYNHDGAFSTTEYTLINNNIPSGGTGSGSFTIPLTALSGTTMMRVRSDWQGTTAWTSADACALRTWGETEDYLITIVPLPANPPNPIEVGVPNCATGGTVQAVGSAPAGETWYWQTSPTGTSTAQNAATPLNILSNGTYYIRSQDNTYLTWSAGAGSVTVTDFPAGPADPSITAPGGNPACGTVSLVSSTAGSGTTNYWQGTNPTGTSTASIADDGSTNTPYGATVSGTYYLRAQDNTTLCWSNPVPSVVTVWDLPTAPILSATPPSVCPGTPVALSAIAPSAPPTGYSVASIPYAPVSPISTTLAGAGPIGDDITTVASIGFNFNFYGNTYSQVQIHTNGYIVFGSSNFVFGSHSPVLIPSTANHNNWAGFWADLNAAAGQITYATLGSAPNRMFVVNYNNVPYWSATPYYSGQIVVYEATGAIDVYLAHTQTSNSNACGLENLTGSAGTAAPGRNAGTWAVDNEAWRFSPIQAMGFLWTPNGVVGGIAAGDEILANTTANPPTSGTMVYTMTLTEPAHGCQNSGTIPVNVLTTPAAPVTTGGATTCGAGTVNVTATGSGGTLNWYDAATGGNLLGSGSPLPVSVTTADVTVWVEENNGTCSGPRSSATAVYTVPPTVTASSNVTSVCAGGTNTGPGGPNNNTAILSSTDAGGQYTSFTWNPGGLSGQVVSVTPGATTTYTVTASGGGCTVLSSVTVNAGAVPNISSVTATPPTVCQGNSSQLIAAVIGGSGGAIPTGYCNPTLFPPPNTCNWIDNVSTTGGISNFSNATATYNGTGSTFFPTSIVSQVLGASFTLNAQVQGTCAIAYYHVWIDWNRDGDLTDPGENVVTANGVNSGNTLTSFTINIPVTASPGQTLMRVTCSGNSVNPVTACDNLSSNYSENEDYVLDILGGAGFTYAWTGSGLNNNSIFNPIATLGSPSENYSVLVTDPYGCYASGSVTLAEPTSNPGNTIATPAAACLGVSFTLSLQNNPGAGANFQWQSSPDGTTWANIGGATNGTYSTTMTVSTYYRCMVGCLSGGSASNPVQVTLTPASACYCTPVFTSYDGTDYISNVTLNTLNNTTGATPNPSYTNYSPMGTNLNNGQPYTISVTSGSFTGENYGAWIDFNQSGTFEPSEQVLPNSVNTLGFETFSNTFTVPVGAVGGVTRLRVVDMYNSVAIPCPTSGYGEAEDYQINLGDPNCISLPTFPLNGGSACPVGLTFTWPSKAGATGYDVYLDGTTGTTLVSPNQTGTSYTPSSQLLPGAYFWRVIPLYPSSSCSTPQTWTFNVQPAPDPIANSNAVNGSICESTALSLSSDNIDPGQSTGNIFSWSGPSGYSSNFQNPTVTNSASPATHTGTYTVVITNQYLCTASASLTIAVNPNPVLSVVSTNGVSCVGLCDGDVTIGATTGLPPYLFFDANFNTSTDSTNGVFTDNQCEGNNQQIDVYDNNGCTSSILYNIGHISSVPPTVNVPNPPISGLPSSACLGTTASISTTAVPLATQYIWDGPSGTVFNATGNPYISTTPSASINFGNPSGSGYYIGVQAANGCGTSMRRVNWVRGTVSVPASITGATIACASTVGTYTTGALTGATQYLWTITGDATVSGTGTTATVTFGPAFTTGTLCVSAQTSCFTSAAKCITITQNAPVVPAITGTFSVCAGQTIQYCVAAQTGIASYNWTLPTGATGSSSSNCINVTFGPTFTGGNISVTSTTVCGQTSAPRSTTLYWGAPTVPASISGTLNGLCGQTVIYTCPSQAGVTFTWTGPSGYSINSGQGSNAISMTMGTFTTGTVCVTANNVCGASAPRCITVNGRPNTPGNITAIPATWCANTQGVEFNVDVTNMTGSYTLSWLYPGPTVATYVLGGGNTTSLTLDWLTGSGPIQVTASNACGNQTRSTNWSNTCREGEELTAAEGSVQLSVNPNPTTGIINLEFTSAVNEKASLQVLDIAGRVIATQEITVVEGLNKTQLDLSKAAKGIYMLNVNTAEGSSKVKVVVE